MGKTLQISLVSLLRFDALNYGRLPEKLPNKVLVYVLGINSSNDRSQLRSLSGQIAYLYVADF